MSMGSAQLRQGSMLGAGCDPALNARRPQQECIPNGTHAAIVACAEYQGRQAMEKPFEQDPVSSTLTYNRPCTTSQGVSFSSFKRENRTYLTFELNGEEEASRFMAAFGSQDPDFVFELLRQAVNTNTRIAICRRAKHQIYDVSHQGS
jgi:hypothetical protein